MADEIPKAGYLILVSTSGTTATGATLGPVNWLKMVQAFGEAKQVAQEWSESHREGYSVVVGIDAAFHDGVEG